MKKTISVDTIFKNLEDKIKKLPKNNNNKDFNKEWIETFGEITGTLSGLLKILGINGKILEIIKEIETTTKEQIECVFATSEKEYLAFLFQGELSKIQELTQNCDGLEDNIEILYQKIIEKNSDFYDLIISFQNLKTIIENNLNLFGSEEKEKIEEKLKTYRGNIEKMLNKIEKDAQK